MGCTPPGDRVGDGKDAAAVVKSSGELEVERPCEVVADTEMSDLEAHGYFHGGGGQLFAFTTATLRTNPRYTPSDPDDGNSAYPDRERMSIVSTRPLRVRSSVRASGS